MSTRTVAVSTQVPVHIIWDAGKHATSRDVSIGLEFIQQNGMESNISWSYTNRDVTGITWLDSITIRIQMDRRVCIDLDVRTRKGFLHVTD